MKKLCSIVLMLLAGTMALSLSACAPGEKVEEKVLTPEEQAILQERRDAVEACMREMVTVLWRAEEDFHYGRNIGGPATYHVLPGRLYRGIPYSAALGTTASFLEFAGQPDEHGIYTISGLDGDALYGVGIIGSDCSSTLTRAWSLYRSANSTISQKLHEKFGVLPVGEYKFLPSWDEEGNIKRTFPAIEANDPQTMYRSYAQLQKGDAVVSVVSGSNHCMMAVSVDVSYLENGDIDPESSTVTVLEQTRKNFLSERTTVREATGETVYIIGGVDVPYTFAYLAKEMYLPVTCKELVDPTPIDDPAFTDSETVFSKDTILTGTISGNRWIDSVTITILDKSGTQVQKASAGVSRGAPTAFDLQKFVTDPPSSVRGTLDMDALPAGQYHCTTTCRITSGEEFTVRDFDFAV